jgi:hypothetical protein
MKQNYLTPALLSDHLLNTVGNMTVLNPNITMAINWSMIFGIYFTSSSGANYIKLTAIKRHST